MIMASKVRDIEIRPLNARSLALSALLGTHPPSLPFGSNALHARQKPPSRN